MVTLAIRGDCREFDSIKSVQTELVRVPKICAKLRQMLLDLKKKSVSIWVSPVA